MKSKKRAVSLIVFMLLSMLLFSILCVKLADADTSYFSCSEGVDRGFCSESKYCGTEELLSNNGFEIDSDNNGVPDGFERLGSAASSMIDSRERYKGAKSIKLTDRFSSFGKTVELQKGGFYSFIAFIKGGCRNVALYYNDNEGISHNLNYEARSRYWYWPATPIWQPITMDFNAPAATLRNLRLACADTAEAGRPYPILWADAMHLERNVQEQPSALVDDCGYCGCAEGSVCTADNTCRAIVQNACTDGTLVGNCKPGTTLFCGTKDNLILSNPGFEEDANSDGIPDSFLLDPNAAINKDTFYADEPYSGDKSIKLTKQWVSFAYLLGGKGAIILSPNTNYLFSAFIKGSCKAPRVFAATGITGTAENDLCKGVCPASEASNGWKRLTARFNSNDIITRLPANRGGNPFLAYLRVSCSDSTPFEMYVDNLNLQRVAESPELVESAELCGASVAELAVSCVLNHDFSQCLALPSSYAAKPIAIEQYAIQYNEPSRCTTLLCRQKVGYYNCPEGTKKTECVKQSLINSGVLLDPSFANGEEMYIESDNFLTSVKKFKLDRKDKVIENKCILSFWGTYLFDYGAILPHIAGNNVLDHISNLKEKRDEIRALRTSIYDTQQHLADSMSQRLDLLGMGFPWLITRDCNAANCNLLKEIDIIPKSDLLCGDDGKFYFCDTRGIKTFSDGRAFFCDAESKIWIEINDVPSPVAKKIGGERYFPSLSEYIQKINIEYSPTLTASSFELVSGAAYGTGDTCKIKVNKDGKDQAIALVPPGKIWNKNNQLRDLFEGLSGISDEKLERFKNLYDGSSRSKEFFQLHFTGAAISFANASKITNILDESLLCANAGPDTGGWLTCTSSKVGRSILVRDPQSRISPTSFMCTAEGWRALQ